MLRFLPESRADLNRHVAILMAIISCGALPQASGEMRQTGEFSQFQLTDLSQILGESESLTERLQIVSHSWQMPEAPVRHESGGFGTRDRLLPDGLLYRSYIAAPHEPRTSSALLYDISDDNWRWDASLGGRFGLFRRDQPAEFNLDAWQIDIEGAVMVRLDPQEKMDVESMDFRFGLLFTGRVENLAFKFGYFHISSHVGDEFLIKNPTFDRINYVRESLIFGTSWHVRPDWRIYGEIGWAMIATGGAEPLQFQFGAEYSPIACCPQDGVPFAAVNLHLREEVDYAAAVTVMSGWQWRGESGRTIRTGVQYSNGPSNQFSFYTRYDNQLGVGIWYDY